MRHRVKGRHLGRTTEHRRALLRNLVAALLEHGRIRTTDAKAREVRPLAERMISLGKRGTLHARRQAVKVVGKGPALDRLFGTVAERFASRPGGYTRLIKAGHRHGDGAPVAYVELLDETPATVRPPGGEGPGKGRTGAAGEGGRSGSRRSSRGSKGGESSKLEARAGKGGGREKASPSRPAAGQKSGGQKSGKGKSGRERSGEASKSRSASRKGKREKEA